MSKVTIYKGMTVGSLSDCVLYSDYRILEARNQSLLDRLKGLEEHNDIMVERHDALQAELSLLKFERDSLLLAMQPFTKYLTMKESKGPFMSIGSIKGYAEITHTDWTNLLNSFNQYKAG